MNDRSFLGDSDNIYLGAYGGGHWDKLSVRGGITYGIHQIETERTATFRGFGDKLKADYDAETLIAFGEVGYQMPYQETMFEPFANLTHVKLKTDGFTKTGGAAALTSKSNTTDTIFATLGLRSSTDIQLGDRPAILSSSVGWRRAFGDRDPQSSLAFNRSDSFLVTGAPIVRDTGFVEIGLDVEMSEQMMLNVSYNGEFGDGVESNSVNANLKINF